MVASMVSKYCDILLKNISKNMSSFKPHGYKFILYFHTISSYYILT